MMPTNVIDTMLEELPQVATPDHARRFRADLERLTVDLFGVAVESPVIVETKVFAAMAVTAQLARAVTGAYPSWAPTIRHGLLTVIADLDKHLHDSQRLSKRKH